MPPVIFRRSRSKKGSQSSISITDPSSPHRLIPRDSFYSPKSPEQIWDQGVERIRERQRSRQGSRQENTSPAPSPEPVEQAKGRHSEATILDVISRYQSDGYVSPSPSKRSLASLPQSIGLPSRAGTRSSLDSRGNERRDSPVQKIERGTGTQHKKRVPSISNTAIHRADRPVPRRHTARFRKSTDVSTGTPRHQADSRPLTISANMADPRYVARGDVPFRTPIFSEAWSDGFPRPPSSRASFSRASSNRVSYIENFVINPTPPTSSRNSINVSQEDIHIARKMARKAVRGARRASKANPSPYHAARFEHSSGEYTLPGSSGSSHRTWASLSTPPCPSTPTTPTSDRYNSTVALQENLKSAFDDDDDDDNDDNADNTGFIGRISLHRRKVFSRKSSHSGIDLRDDEPPRSSTEAKEKKPEKKVDKKRAEMKIKALCGCLRIGGRQ